MTPSEIVGTVTCCLLVIGLLAILFYLTFTVGKEEQKEKQERTKMYKAITKYLQEKEDKDK